VTWSRFYAAGPGNEETFKYFVQHQSAQMLGLMLHKFPAE
jgi:hypothetical protein